MSILQDKYHCLEDRRNCQIYYYYDQEVKYQERYDKLQNASSALVACTPIHSNAVDLMFPSDFANRAIKGQLTFYRPDNKQKDFTIQLKNENGKMQVSSDKLSSGYWRLNIAWSCEGKEYLQEEKLMMP